MEAKKKDYFNRFVSLKSSKAGAPKSIYQKLLSNKKAVGASAQKSNRKKATKEVLAGTDVGFSTKKTVASKRKTKMAALSKSKKKVAPDENSPSVCMRQFDPVSEIKEKKSPGLIPLSQKDDGEFQTCEPGEIQTQTALKALDDFSFRGSVRSVRKWQEPDSCQQLRNRPLKLELPQDQIAETHLEDLTSALFDQQNRLGGEGAVQVLDQSIVRLSSEWKNECNRQSREPVLSEDEVIRQESASISHAILTPASVVSLPSVFQNSMIVSSRETTPRREKSGMTREELSLQLIRVKQQAKARQGQLQRKMDSLLLQAKEVLGEASSQADLSTLYSSVAASLKESRFASDLIPLTFEEPAPVVALDLKETLKLDLSKLAKTDKGQDSDRQGSAHTKLCKPPSISSSRKSKRTSTRRRTTSRQSSPSMRDVQRAEAVFKLTAVQQIIGQTNQLLDALEITPRQSVDVKRLQQTKQDLLAALKESKSQYDIARGKKVLTALNKKLNLLVPQKRPTVVTQINLFSAPAQLEKESKPPTARPVAKSVSSRRTPPRDRNPLPKTTMSTFNKMIAARLASMPRSHAYESALSKHPPSSKKYSSPSLGNSSLPRKHYCRGQCVAHSIPSIPKISESSVQQHKRASPSAQETLTPIEAPQSNTKTVDSLNCLETALRQQAQSSPTLFCQGGTTDEKGEQGDISPGFSEASAPQLHQQANKPKPESPAFEPILERLSVEQIQSESSKQQESQANIMAQDMANALTSEEGTMKTLQISLISQESPEVKKSLAEDRSRQILNRVKTHSLYRQEQFQKARVSIDGVGQESKVKTAKGSLYLAPQSRNRYSAMSREPPSQLSKFAAPEEEKEVDQTQSLVEFIEQKKGNEVEVSEMLSLDQSRDLRFNSSQISAFNISHGGTMDLRKRPQSFFGLSSTLGRTIQDPRRLTDTGALVEDACKPKKQVVSSVAHRKKKK